MIRPYKLRPPKADSSPALRQAQGRERSRRTKAGIHFADLWKRAIVGRDSRFRGNDRTWERLCLAYDSTIGATFPMLIHS